MLVFMASGQGCRSGARAEQAVMGCHTTDDNGTSSSLEGIGGYQMEQDNSGLVTLATRPRHEFVTRCERRLIEEARTVVVVNAQAAEVEVRGQCVVPRIRIATRGIWLVPLTLS